MLLISLQSQRQHSSLRTFPSTPESKVTVRSVVFRHWRNFSKMSMRRLHAHRAYTSLPGTVSQEDREKYECVIHIDQNGTSTLNPNFATAIDAALSRVKQLQNA